ncbi:MAG: hypothetical protein M1827_000427 [Pycnora praestabilis]|nr:MAG: hypothetical protein M1827_000427 [Pycnora praestabilis]
MSTSESSDASQRAEHEIAETEIDRTSTPRPSCDSAAASPKIGYIAGETYDTGMTVEDTMVQCLLSIEDGILSLQTPRIVSPGSTMVQCLLSSENGMLSLYKPGFPRHRRRRGQARILPPLATPVDETRKNVSFFCLAPEIRVPIYRHLLLTSTIAYPIIMSPRRVHLVAYARHANTHSARHVLYAEILETCRLINREGSAILYGENLFHQEYYHPTPVLDGPAIRRWRLSPENTNHVSRLGIFRQKFHPSRVLRTFDIFQSLKELHVTIDLNDIGSNIGIWESLMETISLMVSRLSQFSCEVRLPFGNARYLEWVQGCVATNVASDFNLHEHWIEDFKDFLRKKGLFLGRNLRWSCRTETDDMCGPDCYVYLKIT